MIDSTMPHFSSSYSLIVLTPHVTSHPISIYLNKHFLQSFVQYRPHNESLIFLIAVCGLKTQLRFTISVPLGSQETLLLQSLLALFCDQPVYRYPHPLAVSVGSRCCHLVQSFLSPPSERCLCPGHEVTFHPFSSFILLPTQIFNVVKSISLVSKFTEIGLEVS